MLGAPCLSAFRWTGPRRQAHNRRKPTVCAPSGRSRRSQSRYRPSSASTGSNSKRGCSTGISPCLLLYVGDHPDYDITAGRAAGLRTALVRRGPWGHLWCHDPAVRASAHLVASSLDEIRQVLTGTR